MSVDLLKEVKKPRRKPQPRQRSRVQQGPQRMGTTMGQEATLSVYRTQPRKKLVYPVQNIHIILVQQPDEDMFDLLTEYRGSLTKMVKRKLGEVEAETKARVEVKAINKLVNQLPWYLIKSFFRYMEKNRISDLPSALNRFMSLSKVKDELEKSRSILRSRKAERVGPVPRGEFPDVSESRYIMAGCVSEYKKAPWVSKVMERPVLVEDLVIRETPLTKQWIDSHLRDGWYTLKRIWFINACRFGRPFREETVGYLLNNGKILLESKVLYDACISYFSRKDVVQTNLCSDDYKKAPWAEGILPPVKSIVVKNVPETHRWISSPYKGEWYNLRSSWYKHICKHGRPWVPGVFGYRLRNGSIVPETKNLWILSNSTKQKKEKIVPGKFLDQCVSTLRTPLWVRTPLGNKVGAVGMVTKKTRDMEEWIPEPYVPIKNDWYPLKARWYEYVCQYGREWVPGVMGYKLRDGTIVEETKDLYDDYMATVTSVNKEHLPPDEQSYMIAKEILSEELPTDLVERIRLPNTTNKDMGEAVARINVFASKLTKQPSIHITRISRGQYEPQSLVAMSKEMMLPEIYLNPERDPRIAAPGVVTWDDMDRILLQKQQGVYDRFIKGLKDPIKARRMAVRYKTMVGGEDITRCSDDPVYYLEDGRLFCFDRTQIKGVQNNPETGKPFSQDFIQFQEYLRSPRSARAEQAANIPMDVGQIREEVRPPKRRQLLAPNLLKKVRMDLSKTKVPVYCAMCNKTFADTRFKTTYMGDVVKFCSIACFEQFDFKRA